MLCAGVSVKVAVDVSVCAGVVVDGSGVYVASSVVVGVLGGSSVRTAVGVGEGTCVLCLPRVAVGSISGAFDCVGVLVEEGVAVNTRVGVVVGELDTLLAVAVGVLLLPPCWFSTGVGEVISIPDGVLVSCIAAF